MNLDPESVDNFDVDVWSDSDAGGIDLTVTETNEATGIFEGTVFFTVDDDHLVTDSESQKVTQSPLNMRTIHYLTHIPPQMNSILLALQSSVQSYLLLREHPLLTQELLTPSETHYLVYP